MKGVLMMFLSLNLVALPAYGLVNNSSGPQEKETNYFFVGVAAFVGIACTGISQLLLSGANQKILEQVSKSLVPINDSLKKIEEKNLKLDQVLQEFKLTLHSMQSQQLADRTLLKNELENAANRLEERIKGIEKEQGKMDLEVNQLRSDLNRVQGIILEKLSNSKGGDAE